MPRFNKHYKVSRNVKGYVNQKFAEAEWSSIQRVVRDFQNIAVDGGDGSYYSLTEVIANLINEQSLWTYNTNGTDGSVIKSSEYKIEYIRIHLRCALGESESVSAVSQTVRVLVLRLQDRYGSGETLEPVLADVDGMVHYDELFGNINGVYYDKTKYVHSWATDSDTTAGGQVFFHKLLRPMHSDSIFIDTNTEDVESEKGEVFVVIVGDDPDGTNAAMYGFFEVGFRYKTQ